MALEVTLSSLLTATRLLADNHRLTDAQLIPVINQGCSRLHDKLTAAHGADYKMSFANFYLPSSVTTLPIVYSVTFGSGSTAFSLGATLTGSTSGSKGIIRGVSAISSVTGVLQLSDLSFTPNLAGAGFSASELLTDTSGGSATYVSNNGGCGAGDFYRLRGLDIFQSAGQYLPLKPYVWKDRNAYTNAYAAFGTYPGTYLRYRILGKTLAFVPKPSASQLLRMSYTPTVQPLVVLTDTIDGIDGWEQYIVNFAAMQCLLNEECDTSAIERQQGAYESQLTKMAEERDDGSPQVVAAASDSDDYGTYGSEL